MRTHLRGAHGAAPTRRASLLLVLPLLASIAAPAARAAHGGSSTSCQNLFALGLAQQFHLADCTLPMAGASAPTAGDLCWNNAFARAMTPNECSNKVFQWPPAPQSGTSGTFAWTYLAACDSGLGGGGVVCPGQEVRCVDGTRPGFYVDWATDAAGADVTSNHWLFYISGGGACETGDQCWDHFQNQVGDTSTCNPATCPLFDEDGDGVAEGRSIVAGFLSPTGILYPGPENRFHGFNRVRLQKCTDDAYLGTSTDTTASTPAGAVDELYHHGNRFFQRVFQQLANPASFPGRPTLDQAETVVLVGNSGGGKSLMLTGDDHREFLEDQILNSTAAIRLVLDAHFLPSLEHENARNSAAVDLYDGDLWRSPTPASSFPLPPDFNGLTGVTYGTGGFFTGQSATSVAAFQPPIDASCLDTHTSEPERCNDQQHVLLHHLTTPAFVRMDQNDPVKRNDHPPFADVDAYLWATPEFHERVPEQLAAFLAGFQSRSELALDLDTSPGVPDDNARKPADQNLAVWAPFTSLPPPYTDSHTGLVNATHFGFAAATNRVALKACRLVNGLAGTGNPELGWRPGPPTTAMSALHAWVTRGTAIDAVADYTNRRRGYRWVDASAPCPKEVPALPGLWLALAAAALAGLGALRIRRPPRAS